MKETEALKHWREFEYFVLDYLKEKYNIKEEKFAILTPPTGDGGYDGVLYSKINLSNGNIREILFEAKLRSAIGTSLPLNDFSKALVIAVNRFTDEVYIASNLIFSSETLYQLNIYAKRLGMKIETVNGRNLYEWYDNQCLNIKKKYGTDFINFLKKSSEAISSDVCNNYQNSELSPVCNIKYIKDNDRSNLINSIQDSLSSHRSGLALFYGEKGCGKSCMCMEMMNYLDGQGYNIFEINMCEYNTSRSIFLKLLECVWGFSPEIIIHGTASEIEELFHCIGATDLSSDSIRCLQFIFSKNIEEYTGNSDTYQYILLSIIEPLFEHYSNRIPYCIHVHNMDSAYAESCEFIQKVIGKLNACKIIFLVEIRENYAGEMQISTTEWSKIISRLKNFHNIIGSYDVCKFSVTESELYIKNVIPSLNYDQVKQLAQLLPDNPLVLDAALHILQPKLVNGFSFEFELENELRYFNRNHDSGILKETLRQLMQRVEFRYLAQPFAMLSLLKGSCSIENIVEITGDNKEEIINLLNKTGFTNIHDNIVTVKHEFYVNTFQNYSVYISNTVLQNLTKKMSNRIEIFYMDVLEQSILHTKLLNINQDYKTLLLMCKKTGKALFQQGDTAQAFEIYKIAYNAFESKVVNGVDFILPKLEILENMIIIKWHMLGGSDNELDILLTKFGLLVDDAKKIFKHHTKYIEACIYKFLFEMKKMHLKSEHKKCLQYAYIAKRLAQKKNGYKNFPFVLEQILWLKSLSIKHTSGMEACLESFKYDIKKYPEFVMLQFAYNTHKAASIAGKTPKLALCYFESNKKFYDKLSMAEQLHNRVNISNMHFYLRDYHKAKETSEDIVKDALLYDVNIELGRAYNTIANCYCIEMNFEYSINFYNKSISRFEGIAHSIHLWSPIVNCAFVHVTQNNYSEALALLKKAVPIFLRRRDELVNFNATEINNANKLNIGVIITLHLLRRIADNMLEAKSLYSQLFDEVQAYMPEQINEICLDIQRFEEYFANTIYEHGGNILLKL